MSRLVTGRSFPEPGRNLDRIRLKATMKIYLLERTDVIGHDEVDAFVVRSTSHIRARRLANERCADEGEIWDNRDLVKATYLGTCSKGDHEVILRSYNAG